MGFFVVFPQGFVSSFASELFVGGCGLKGSDSAILMLPLGDRCRVLW